MTGALTLDPAALVPHPRRGSLLDEIHARPFQPVTAPARFLRFAFLNAPGEAAESRAAFAALCAARGAPAPAPEARHHVARLAEGDLAFELHGEFTTWTWILRGRSPAPFDVDAAVLARQLPALPQPGPHVVSVDLSLVDAASDAKPEAHFDLSSLAASTVKGDAARIASDFRPTPAGFTRLLVVNRSLEANATGALCQRLLELETYRTLALLGLPEAQRLTPETARFESELAAVTAATTKSAGLADDSDLLRRLTVLAAELEAATAAVAYRFGATRAYDEIVGQRLQAIGEEPVAQWPTFASFLTRRGAPAMRTINTVQRRHEILADKLTRATALLRSRVDVAIGRQNSELLEAMNDRARMQLRLQQTVEGLSVAAISYYVVGLAGYVFKAMKDAGLPIDPNIAMGAAVPAAILGVWWVVRRIRSKHAEH